MSALLDAKKKLPFGPFHSANLARFRVFKNPVSFKAFDVYPTYVKRIFTTFRFVDKWDCFIYISCSFAFLLKYNVVARIKCSRIAVYFFYLFFSFAGEGNSRRPF